MATRKFTLNTAPHEAEIGDTTLLFIPEAAGDEFLDGYARLREAQKTATGSAEDSDPGDVRKVTAALREFLADLMIPESKELFTRIDLIEGGEVVKSVHTWTEADAFTSEQPGREAVHHMRLPPRVLVALTEWSAELYGGGASDRPTGRPGGSASSRRTPGIPSKAN